MTVCRAREESTQQGNKEMDLQIDFTCDNEISHFESNTEEEKNILLL